MPMNRGQNVAQGKVWLPPGSWGSLGTTDGRSRLALRGTHNQTVIWCGQVWLERAPVKDRSLVLLEVETEARRVLGDDAPEWMARPSRLFDGIAPTDLAASPEGARAVLHELRHASAILRASRLRKRAWTSAKAPLSRYPTPDPYAEPVRA